MSQESEYLNHVTGVFSIQEDAALLQGISRTSGEYAQERTDVIKDMTNGLATFLAATKKLESLAADRHRVPSETFKSIDNARTTHQTLQLPDSAQKVAETIGDEIGNADTAARDIRREVTRIGAIASNLAVQVVPLQAALETLREANLASDQGVTDLNNSAHAIDTAGKTYLETIWSE